VRVLLASNYQPPHMGGIEFAAEALKQCWERAGHKVTWITTDIPRGTRPLTADNIRIPAWNFAEDLWEINTPLIHPSAYPELLRQVRAHDVVSTHSLAPGLATVVLHAAVRNHKPTVVTQHVGVIPMPSRLLSVIQKHVNCHAANWCARHDVPITFVGEAVRKWFADHTTLRADRTFMTPAGINAHTYYFVPDEERVALRGKWKLRDDQYNVLFVGRFYEKKGMPLMREVAKRCPDIQFSFRGHGPIDPAKWGLPNVHVIGYVSDVELRELYGSFDVCIMPSIGEGWPAVIPQAMACGLGCLISPETFAGHNRDPEQFLICRRDPEAMADILRRAARKEIALLKHRAALSEYSRSQWDWDRTAEIYLELFQKEIAKTIPR